MKAAKEPPPIPQIHVTLLAVIAILGAILTYILMIWTVGDSPPGHDFWWSKVIAQSFLTGEDPYSQEFDSLQVPYPLPIFFIGAFFLPFSAQVSAAIFNGMALFLLLWGMKRSDELWRWPLFLSLPFLSAFILPQWATIFLAAWYLPIIGPYFVLIKPQSALPVAIAKWSWKGIFIAAGILLITLIVYPTWPIVWLGLTGNYLYIIPFLILPVGPLLLLSIIYWRAPPGRLLFFLSILPFRAYYDLPLLWLVPQNRYQVWFLTIISWIPISFFNHNNAFIQPMWSIFALFLPALCMLAWNQDKDRIMMILKSLFKIETSNP